MRKEEREREEAREKESGRKRHSKKSTKRKKPINMSMSKREENRKDRKSKRKKREEGERKGERESVDSCSFALKHTWLKSGGKHPFTLWAPFHGSSTQDNTNPPTASPHRRP